MKSMIIDNELKKLCRLLLERDDMFLESEENGVEITLVEIPKDSKLIRDTLFESLYQITEHNTMFCSISLIWGNYLFQDMGDEPDKYFVIRQKES